MPIGQCVDKEVILMSLNTTDRFGAIVELVDLLALRKKVLDRNIVLNDVLVREQESPTGLDNGIAIPHASTPGVTGLTVAIGHAPVGIEFHCIDQQPAHWIFLVLSPDGQKDEHFEALREIVFLAGDPDKRDLLSNAMTVDDVVNMLKE